MKAELRLDSIFPRLELRPENQLEADVLEKVSPTDIVNITKRGWGTDVDPFKTIALEFVRTKKKAKLEELKGGKE